MQLHKRKLAILLAVAGLGFSSQLIAQQATVPVTTQAGVPAPGKWLRLAGMLENVSEHTVSVLGDKMYIVGGMPSTRISTNTTEVYDIKANKWTMGPPLPTVVNHAVQATVDGRIYVIGGQWNNDSSGPPYSYMNTVFMYDPKINRWSPKASMPTARAGGVAAVIGSKIYVVGGRPPRGHDMAVYDTETDKWEALPDMPTARNHLTGGAVDGKVYAIGGREPAGGPGKIWDVVEMYDPATKSWSKKAQLPRPRGALFGGVVKGCIHAFGGEGNDEAPTGVFPDHDIYNPKTNTWTRMPPMMIPVHAINGVGIYNDIIYIPGGSITQGGDSNSAQVQAYNPGMSCL